MTYLKMGTIWPDDIQKFIDENKIPKVSFGYFERMFLESKSSLAKKIMGIAQVRSLSGDLVEKFLKEISEESIKNFIIDDRDFFNFWKMNESFSLNKALVKASPVSEDGLRLIKSPGDLLECIYAWEDDHRMLHDGMKFLSKKLPQDKLKEMYLWGFHSVKSAIALLDNIKDINFLMKVSTFSSNIKTKEGKEFYQKIQNLIDNRS